MAGGSGQTPSREDVHIQKACISSLAGAAIPKARGDRGPSALIALSPRRHLRCKYFQLVCASFLVYFLITPECCNGIQGYLATGHTPFHQQTQLKRGLKPLRARQNGRKSDFLSSPSTARMSDRKDFSPSAMSSPTHHTHNVQFDLETGRSPTATEYLRPPSIRSDPEPEHSTALPAPILKRYGSRSRSMTVTSFKDLDKSTLRPNWHPGQEPGLDPSKPNGGRAQTPTHYEDCQITVVDFSEDDMVMHDLNNAELIKFINMKQEDWIKCRWININGLSWDIIEALGKRMKLHRLAIEDLVNTNNRTKADWYTDHTYMVLTLQKLVHLHEDEDGSDSDSDDHDSIKKLKRGPFSKAIHKMFSNRKTKERYDETQRQANKVAGVHDPMNG